MKPGPVGSVLQNILIPRLRSHFPTSYTYKKDRQRSGGAQSRVVTAFRLRGAVWSRQDAPLAYPGQLLLVHLAVALSRLRRLVLGQRGLALLVLRLGFRRRVVDPGVQIQPEDTACISSVITPGGGIRDGGSSIQWKSKSSCQAASTDPSGTGTFFWALGATGFNSPVNKAVSSSPTSTSFCWSFWMHFTSCNKQEA